MAATSISLPLSDSYLHSITDEEDGHVVSDHIKVTLAGVELDGETARVTERLCKTVIQVSQDRNLLTGLHLGDNPRKYHKSNPRQTLIRTHLQLSDLGQIY